MNWYKQKKIAGDLKDIFPDIFSIKKHDIISEEQITEEETINLYRGFDINKNDDIANAFKKTPTGDYILSPKKCEGGVLWFSSDLQINPMQYSGGGDYLLTYPLTIKKHYIKTTYDDGKIHNIAIDNDIDPTKNSKYMDNGNCVYELPDGFYFSYKTQKHIICDKEIEISPSMISEQHVLDNKLNLLREKIAEGIQTILNKQQLNEENFNKHLNIDNTYKAIVNKLIEIIYDNIENIKIIHHYDKHGVIVYSDTEAYYVGIPPYLYKINKGNNLTKMPNAKIEANNIIIEKINREDI